MPGCIFETEKLSDLMPAFLVTTGPSVYVKYPTYKIQKFNGKNPLKSTSDDKINDLLKDVGNRSHVYLTKAVYIIAGDKFEKMDFPFVSEVMCLEITLANTIRCKNKIVEILQSNNYNVSVYPAYCIRGMKVELLDDKKYFRVVQPE